MKHTITITKCSQYNQTKIILIKTAVVYIYVQDIIYSIAFLLHTSLL